MDFWICCFILCLASLPFPAKLTCSAASTEDCQLAMNYLISDGNLLGRYAHSNFHRYPKFHVLGCSSHVLLPAVLRDLESPQVVVVTSLGSMLASAGSMEPPNSRLSSLSACLKEVWDLMVRFSEENSGTQVYFLRHCNIFYLLIPPSFAIIVFIRTTYSTIVYTIYMVLCILIFLYFVDFSFTLYLSNSFLFFLYFFNFSLYLYREDI
jgi:hypothetical protein